MVGRRRQTGEQKVVVADRAQTVQDLRERRHDEVVGRQQRDPATANCNQSIVVVRRCLRPVITHARSLFRRTAAAAAAEVLPKDPPPSCRPDRERDPRASDAEVNWTDDGAPMITRVATARIVAAVQSYSSGGAFVYLQVTRGSLGQRASALLPSPKRQLGRFRRFCTAHLYDKHRHRQTDRQLDTISLRQEMRTITHIWHCWLIINLTVIVT